MKILDTSVYYGPSIYALFPTIRHTVDLGPLEEWPTGRLGPAFVDPLLGALPGLHEHGCSYGEPGGFVRRLREDDGTWLGHVLEHCAIELQNVAGAEVTFGKTRGAGAPGVYNMIYAYEQEEVGLRAAELAIDEERWLNAPDRRRPSRPSLSPESDAFHAARLGFLQTRRAA